MLLANHKLLLLHVVLDYNVGKAGEVVDWEIVKNNRPL